MKMIKEFFKYYLATVVVIVGVLLALVLLNAILSDIKLLINILKYSIIVGLPIAVINLIIERKF